MAHSVRTESSWRLGMESGLAGLHMITNELFTTSRLTSPGRGSLPRVSKAPDGKTSEVKRRD